MEQDTATERVAKSRHILHVLPQGDERLGGILAPLVERITPSEGEEAIGAELLILVPSMREAVGLAASINAGLDVEGVLLTPLLNAARATRRLATGPAAVVTTPALASQLLSQSLLKLDAVKTLVLVGVEDLLRDAPLLDVILAESPKTAARIMVAASTSEALSTFIASHAHRARVITHDVLSEGSYNIEYVVVDPSARADALSRLLERVDPAHATVVSAEESAEDACFALAALGYAPGDPLVEYSDGPLPEGEALVVLFDAPLSTEELDALYETNPARVVVFVAPDALAAFLRAAGNGARPLTLTLGVDDANSRDARVREQVVAALSGGPVHRELLALAPLFSAYDPAWVAAALLRIAEQNIDRPAPPARAAVQPQPQLMQREAPPARVAPATPVRARPDVEESDRGSSGEGMATLFISVGERDGARKGDLVGAIAGESGFSSEKIGRITMRDSFSLVEVEDAIADEVITAITGKTIRGRVINARRDQGPGPSSGTRERSSERPARGGFGGGARGRDGGSRGKPSGGFDKPRRSSEGSRGRPSRDEQEGGRASRFGESDSRRSSSDRPRGGFGGGGSTSRGKFERSEGGRGGSRPRGGGFDRDARGARSGSFGGVSRDVGTRAPSGDDRGRGAGRDGGRPTGPRAIRESEEWRDRGDRLRSSKRGGPRSR